MSLSCRLGFHSRSWHRGATNAEGVTHKLCDRCLAPVGVLLGGAVIDTALVQIVAGTPTGKAQRTRKDNTLKFPAERASER